MVERNTEDVEQLLDSIYRDLLEEFRDRVSPSEIERMTEDSYRPYATSRIKTFVPILVRREARSRLRRIAREAS